MGYRRSTKRGTWIAKLKQPGNGFKYFFHPLGIANDGLWGTHAAVPTPPLDYGSAVDACWKWAKRKRAEEAGIEIAVGAYSVAQCMSDYVAHSARERQIKPDDSKLTRLQATIDAFILPTLGKLDCGKLTHIRLKAWRDALADSAPPRSYQGWQRASLPDAGSQQPECRAPKASQYQPGFVVP